MNWVDGFFFRLLGWLIAALSDTDQQIDFSCISSDVVKMNVSRYVYTIYIIVMEKNHKDIYMCVYIYTWHISTVHIVSNDDHCTFSLILYLIILQQVLSTRKTVCTSS